MLRFEELAFELITPGFYRVFFRDMEIGELNVEELRFKSARRVVLKEPMRTEYVEDQGKDHFGESSGRNPKTQLHQRA